MTTNGTLVDAEQNHRWLLDEFVRLLLLQEPSSVLDVGCGAGRLLKSCRAAGVATRGIDRAGPRLDALREEGHDVLEGTAYELPVDDRSVDWVTLRHVPHHLEDPPRAFAEALRVAQTGVIIAEPCYDSTLPTQQAAIAVDAWEKRQHRRGGMYHAEVMDLAALLGALPGSADREFEIEVVRNLRLRDRSVSAFERDAQELLADVPGDHPERAALAKLMALLERTGLTFNGSQCVVLRRR